MTMAAPRLEVYVQITENLDLALELPESEQWRAWFQIWSKELIPETGDYELTLRLTDNSEIQHLNQDYRQINRPTDVLAFAATEIDYPDLSQLADHAEPTYLGDIVVSMEMARDQAAVQGHSLRVELAWLACHGFLHLLGWDHPDEEHLTAMLDQQRHCLGEIGLELGPGSEF